MKYAMVFQDFNQLLPWKTACENVMYPLLLNQYGNKKECKAEAERFLEVVGLKDFRDFYPNCLSGGMKQRVAIARALAMRT